MNRFAIVYPELEQLRWRGRHVTDVVAGAGVAMTTDAILSALVERNINFRILSPAACTWEPGEFVVSFSVDRHLVRSVNHLSLRCALALALAIVIVGISDEDIPDYEAIAHDLAESARADDHAPSFVPRHRASSAVAIEDIPF